MHQQVFVAFFEEMDFELPSISEDAAGKPKNPPSESSQCPSLTSDSVPEDPVQHAGGSEPDGSDPFAELEASSAPFFNESGGSGGNPTKQPAADSKPTAANEAVDPHMAKIDALNASLKRLDELTNYADDLMTGIIETDFEKVDKLLADEKMNKKQSLCVYCNLEFNDPVAFIGHLMVRHMHAAAKRVFCRVCRHECEDPKELQAHVQERHFREPECRLCKAEMNAEHEKVHPFDEWVLLKLACDYCSYTTKDPHQYVVHNMLCTNNPQNENYQPTDEGRVCPICKQVFGCNAYMLRHKQKKHTNADDQNAVVNQFQCEECGRRFGSILSLGGHKKVHRREGDGDLIRFDKLKRPEDRQTAAASAPPPKRRRTAK